MPVRCARLLNAGIFSAESETPPDAAFARGSARRLLDRVLPLSVACERSGSVDFRKIHRLIVNDISAAISTTTFGARSRRLAGIGQNGARIGLIVGADLQPSGPAPAP